MTRVPALSLPAGPLARLGRGALAWLALTSLAAAPHLPRPEPGSVTVASAPPGESPCDRYAETLSEDEIAQLSRQLSLMAPARHAKVAKSIRIVNVEAGPAAGLGPFAQPGDGASPPTISVPAGFRRLQCRLVQVGFYYLINYFKRSVPLSPPMRDCMEEKADPAACIDEVAGKLIARAERDPPGRFNPEMTEVIRRTADSGFLQVLLHEFAHIAYGHFDRRTGSAAAARTEADADAYSLLRIVIGGQSPLGAFWTYTGMSLADPYLEDGGGAHGRSACRASISNDVLSRLTNVANDAYYWSMDPPADYLKRRAGSAERKSPGCSTSATPPGARPGKPRLCLPSTGIFNRSRPCSTGWPEPAARRPIPRPRSGPYSSSLWPATRPAPCA